MTGKMLLIIIGVIMVVYPLESRELIDDHTVISDGAVFKRIGQMEFISEYISVIHEFSFSETIDHIKEMRKALAAIHDQIYSNETFANSSNAYRVYAGVIDRYIALEAQTGGVAYKALNLIEKIELINNPGKPGHKFVKRAPFSFIGQGLSYYLGLSSEDDLNAVSERITSIENEQNKWISKYNQNTLILHKVTNSIADIQKPAKEVQPQH